MRTLRRTHAALACAQLAEVLNCDELHALNEKTILDNTISWAQLAGRTDEIIAKVMPLVRWPLVRVSPHRPRAGAAARCARRREDRPGATAAGLRRRRQRSRQLEWSLVRVRVPPLYQASFIYDGRPDREKP